MKYSRIHIKHSRISQSHEIFLCQTRKMHSHSDKKLTLKKKHLHILCLSQIYTYEMTIVKVVEGDAGGYRCEVTSKDKCDSCTFEVTVEGIKEQLVN